MRVMGTEQLPAFLIALQGREESVGGNRARRRGRRHDLRGSASLRTVWRGGTQATKRERRAAHSGTVICTTTQVNSGRGALATKRTHKGPNAPRDLLHRPQHHRRLPLHPPPPHRPHPLKDLVVLVPPPDPMSYPPNIVLLLVLPIVLRPLPFIALRRPPIHTRSRGGHRRIREALEDRTSLAQLLPLRRAVRVDERRAVRVLPSSSGGDDEFPGGRVTLTRVPEEGGLVASAGVEAGFLFLDVGDGEGVVAVGGVVLVVLGGGEEADADGPADDDAEGGKQDEIWGEGRGL